MTILLAFILSIDSFGISVSYKIRNIKLPLLSKLIICLMSFFSTYLAVTISEMFVSNIIGSVLLIITGLIIIKGSVTDKPEKCDINNSKKLEWAEALYMGTILSFDSFFSGIGLGFIDISPLFFAALTGVFQLALLYVGEVTANTILSKKILKEKTCEILSGLILIIIGVFKLF